MAAFISAILRNFCSYWADETGETRIPLRNALCPDCDGDGYRALHGYDVTEMIREDPDFGEDYARGHYDTMCEECRGRGVIAELDCDSASPEMVKSYEAYMADYYSDLAVQAAERAAGC